jgi:hypothetical protein
VDGFAPRPKHELEISSFSLLALNQ